MTADLVLLHPLGSDRSFWDPVLPALEERLPGLRAHALDLPGHGAGAPLPEDASLEDFSRAVVDELDGIAARGGPVHLVGVSLGGLVAQQVAAQHPELVAGVVLVDTVAVYGEQMRRSWRDRAATAREAGLEPLADAMEQMWFTEEFRASSPTSVRRARAVFLAQDREGYARTCRALEHADTRALVPTITAPTLVVCGRQDAPPFVEAADWLAGTIDGAEQVWLEGRHAVVLERPRELAAALADFLGRH